MTPNDRACEAIDEGRWADALAHAEEAARLEPTWAAPWWNVAVAAKHLRRWRAVLDAVARHAALVGDVDAGLEWSAGIAATALREWPRARAAWRVCGFELDEGDGPPRVPLGTAVVRAGDEAIWVERIDPCRGVVLTVPRTRGHRDVLLHDGEPVATRRLGERVVPVFVELAHLERSRWQTWEARLTGGAAVIETLVNGTDVAVEDWGGDVAGVAARNEDALRTLRRSGAALVGPLPVT